jgi:hypothetical protein
MGVNYVPIHLPSRCLPYGDKVKSDEVAICTFTGKEEEAIAEMALNNPRKKILEVLTTVLQGIDPKILTSGDVSYILLWEAINSYTNEYPLTITCQHCYQSVDVTVDLGKINSVELPEDFKQPYDIELPTSTAHLRLGTLLDEIQVYNFSEKGKSPYLYSYALAMVDKEVPAYERALSLECLPAKYLAKIRQFHKDFTHGPDYIAPYHCPNCEEDGEVLVPFRLDNFIQECTVS